MLFTHMALMITQFFGAQSGSSTQKLWDSNNMILTLLLVNLNYDLTMLIESDKFKLQDM